MTFVLYTIQKERGGGGLALSRARVTARREARGAVRTLYFNVHSASFESVRTASAAPAPPTAIYIN